MSDYAGFITWNRLDRLARVVGQCLGITLRPSANHESESTAPLGGCRDPGVLVAGTRIASDIAARPMVG